MTFNKINIRCLSYIYVNLYKKKIPLFVWLPVLPKIKRNVERINHIITEEFLYETLVDSLVVLLKELNRFIDNYNTFRPHSSWQSPFCILNLCYETLFLSHVL